MILHGVDTINKYIKCNTSEGLTSCKMSCKNIEILQSLIIFDFTIVCLFVWLKCFTSQFWERTVQLQAFKMLVVEQNKKTQPLPLSLSLNIGNSLAHVKSPISALLTFTGCQGFLPSIACDWTWVFCRSVTELIVCVKLSQIMQSLVIFTVKHLHYHIFNWEGWDWLFYYSDNSKIVLCQERICYLIPMVTFDSHALDPFTFSF